MHPVVAVFAAVLLTLPLAARAADRLTFGTDWVAEAEHGGFYQALATGLYERAGLDVEVRQGGPQVNNKALLAGGRLDIAMVSNSQEPIAALAEGVPLVAVAAFMQKDPQCLMVHPDQPVDGFADMKGYEILISDHARQTYWLYLQQTFGLTDDQIRPYTYNLQPWIADPKSIVQGYSTNEPLLARQAGVDPKVFLIADAGYPSYAAVITVRRDWLDANRDVLQRFIDASIEGWRDFLHGDPEPAFALIAQENPDMPREIMEFGRQTMLERGIVDGVDATTLGIGAMTDDRWQALFDVTVAAGIYPADFDFRPAYTLEFVNKGVGLAK